MSMLGAVAMFIGSIVMAVGGLFVASLVAVVAKWGLEEIRARHQLHSPPGKSNAQYKRGYTNGLLRAATIVRALMTYRARPLASDAMRMLAESIERDEIGDTAWAASFWSCIECDAEDRGRKHGLSEAATIIDDHAEACGDDAIARGLGILAGVVRGGGLENDEVLDLSKLEADEPGPTDAARVG